MVSSFLLKIKTTSLGRGIDSKAIYSLIEPETAYAS